MMKFSNQILFIFLAIFPFLSVQASEVRFFNGTYEQLKAQASIENKPYFVCFYKDDCHSSQKMNDITFEDVSVASYIAQHYLAYRVEFHTFEGFDLAAKFGVYHFPNVTIFTPQGRPIYEIEGYQEPETLIGNLTTEAYNMRQPGFCPGKFAHFQPKPKTQLEVAKVEYPAGFKFDVPITHLQEGINVPPSAPVEKPTIVERPLVERYAETNAPAFKPAPTPAPNNDWESAVAMRGAKPSEPNVTRSLLPANAIKNPAPKPAAPKNVLPKEVVSNSPKPATAERKLTKYAVQVGAFREMSMAQDMVNRFKNKGESQIQLKQTTQEGENMYKVLVGGFNSRSEASEKLAELKENGDEGFIISL